MSIKKSKSSNTKTCLFLNSLSVQFALTLLIFAFGFCNIYAQHLFTVDYNGLSQENANLVRTEVARTVSSISTMSSTRNHNDKTTIKKYMRFHFHRIEMLKLLL